MEVLHTVKCLTMGMPAIMFGGHPMCRAGDERLAGRVFEAEQTLGMMSDAFGSGEMMPTRFTADGSDMSPPLSWWNAPAGCRSYALIVEDPDAPTPNPFVHWLAYNIPPEVRKVPESIPVQEMLSDPVSMRQGKNSRMKIGYTGCAPPKGDSSHHYHFQLFALDRVLDLAAGAGRSALMKAMKGHVLSKGDLVGTYQR